MLRVLVADDATATAAAAAAPFKGQFQTCDDVMSAFRSMYKSDINLLMFRV